MRWKEMGAQSMLNLRCIEASELWDVVTEQHRIVSVSKFGRHRKNYCDDFSTADATIANGGVPFEGREQLLWELIQRLHSDYALA